MLGDDVIDKNIRVRKHVEQSAHYYLQRLKLRIR